MFRPEVGDWKCNDCIKINKKRNTKCFFCRKEKNIVCGNKDIVTVNDVVNRTYDDKNLRSDDENISIYTSINKLCNICRLEKSIFMFSECKHSCMCLKCFEHYKTVNKLYKPESKVGCFICRTSSIIKKI